VGRELLSTIWVGTVWSAGSCGCIDEALWSPEWASGFSPAMSWLIIFPRINKFEA
jgi:hypothetical protein